MSTINELHNPSTVLSRQPAVLPRAPASDRTSAPDRSADETVQFTQFRQPAPPNQSFCDPNVPFHRFASGYGQVHYPVDSAHLSAVSSTSSSTMVYPPRAPETTALDRSPAQYNRSSQTSPSLPSEHPNAFDGPSTTSSPGPRHKMPSPDERSSRQKRRTSDNEEVVAGLALARLSAGAKEGESPSQPPKKIKKEEHRRDKDSRKSCSECRRLKAKCDRVFPCSNCRRRGCALVCPDGDLSCMQGKRLVLASTEQLHERIAQLEAALSQAHGKINSSQHPLLAPQYLDGGFVNQPPPSIDSLPRPTSSASPPPLIKHSSGDASPKERSSVSSLALLTPNMAADGPVGQSRMALENLLLDGDKAAPEGKREDEWVGENAAPAMIVGNVGQNPTSDASEHRKIVDRLREILLIIPPREVTRKRANSFWDNSLWFNSLLGREEFESVYEPAVYSPTPTNPLSPHKLACVLMVLVLDTYFDLNVEEENPAIAQYWEGAQQCFDTRFGWAASVAGVQALGLAALFVAFGWRGARASNFYWLRQMTSAAQQLGLHKDPHSSLPADEREFRRRVFWECYSIDCLMSINHGQRAAIPFENIETKMPERGTIGMGNLKYEYMVKVKAAVIDIGCRPDSSPASWEQISSVHQTLMQFDLEKYTTWHCPILIDKTLPPISNAGNAEGFDVAALTRTTTSMCHYKAMMFLYRPSLRRLIARLRNQNEKNVTFSTDERQTVTMTYNACHAITRCSFFVSRTHPRLAARNWSIWVQTFSAAVSMAALAIWCGPHLEPTFIQSAYNELCEACDMIKENGSKRSQGVQTLLPVLQSLVSSRYPRVTGRDPSSARVSVEGEDMLFALLGGQVDQRGVSPTQGNLMNPPSHFGHPQQSNQILAPALVPSQRPKSGSANAQQSINNDSAQAIMAMGYDPSLWSGQMMALPVVGPVPSASATEGYHQPMYPSQVHQRPERPQIDTSMQSMPHMGFDTTGEWSNEDLWARLQTFYEPAPTYWGQSVQGVHPGYPMDYNGMTGM